MSKLKIAAVITADTGQYKKMDVELSDENNVPQGKATLFIKSGHGIEAKFENLIKLLIKPTK